MQVGMRWIAAMLVVAFGAAFWEANHRLHQRAGLSYKPDADAGEQPRDFLMGLATFIGLLPVLVAPSLPQLWYVVMMSAWPLAVVVALGVWRDRHSVSAALLFATHGTVVALLALLEQLRPLDACLQYSLSCRDEDFIGAVGHCGQAAQFWTSSWITVSIAFVTLFGAALVSVYAIEPKDFGWPARPEQRQILGLLYSGAAVWLLIEGAAFLGLPAIRFTMRAIQLTELASERRPSGTISSGMLSPTTTATQTPTWPLQPTATGAPSGESEGRVLVGAAERPAV